MSDLERPAGLPADHQLILESSRLTQSQSEESIVRAKAAIKRSRFHLQRSAERIVHSKTDSTKE